MDVYLGNGLQAVLVSLATVAVLGLLRLMTPSVRWGRRLKAETEILSSLPEGMERDLWSKRVEAQAERLRLYRESFTFQAGAVAWFAFTVLTSCILIVTAESLSGWAFTRELIEHRVFAFIPIGLMLLVFAVVALIIIARLILGGTVSTMADGRGVYPKMSALADDEERRLAERRRTHQRGWAVSVEADREKRSERRASRSFRRD